MTQSPGQRFTVAIVDDEPLARSNIRTLLAGDDTICVVAMCGDGADAIEQIRAKRPDIVFLDVQMPELDGFDVLERLAPRVPPAIVFVTAYDSFAIRAFEAGALDYLLKPFDDARFARALERAKGAVIRAPERAQPQGVFVKERGRVRFVKASEIDWIEGADYNAHLRAGGASYRIRKTLSALEDEFAGSGLVRVHRSVIVNLRRIAALEINEGGEYDVVLHDGTVLRTSRRYRKNLRALLPGGVDETA